MCVVSSMSLRFQITGDVERVIRRTCSRERWMKSMRSSSAPRGSPAQVNNLRLSAACSGPATLLHPWPPRISGTLNFGLSTTSALFHPLCSSLSCCSSFASSSFGIAGLASSATCTRYHCTSIATYLSHTHPRHVSFTASSPAEPSAPPHLIIVTIITIPSDSSKKRFNQLLHAKSLHRVSHASSSRRSYLPPSHSGRSFVARVPR